MPNSFEDKNIALCATLAAIAYQGANQDQSTDLISKALGQEDLPTQQEWELAWGPVVHKSNLMYIVEGPKLDLGSRFALVIRGTTKSPRSILQDLELELASLPWLLPNAPSGTKISSGIAQAFIRLLEMKCSDGLTALDFLMKQEGNNELLVTGHSLGGCLASVMPLYLSDQLPKNWHIKPYTFAGQSAGNQDFADFFESTFKENIRFYNRHDVVPMLWNHDSLEQVKHLYPEEGEPKCDLLFAGLIDLGIIAAQEHFFQPANATSLPGNLYSEHGLIPFEDEVGAQHNHNYYMYLAGVSLSAIQGTQSHPGIGFGWSPPKIHQKQEDFNYSSPLKEETLDYPLGNLNNTLGGIDNTLRV